MKRAAVVLAVCAVAVFGSGCAGADHSWRGEFTARLEGATGVLEEAQEEIHRGMTQVEYFTVLAGLGKTLFFKSELVKKLDPPAGCEALQVKGGAALYGNAKLLGDLFKNLTPQLEHDLPTVLEDEVAKLEKLEREAATCE